MHEILLSALHRHSGGRDSLRLEIRLPVCSPVISLAVKVSRRHAVPPVLMPRHDDL